MWYLLYSLLCVVRQAMLDLIQHATGPARLCAMSPNSSAWNTEEPLVERLAAGWCPRRFLVECANPDPEISWGDCRRQFRPGYLIDAQRIHGPSFVGSLERLLPAVVA